MIKREVGGGSANDAIIAVCFFVMVTVLARCDDENFVSAIGHAFCEVATKSRDAVNGGPVHI